MEKIDQMKSVPVIGETYLVPCFLRYGNIVLVHNNLHDDKENGQHYRHYHVDSRFEGNTRVDLGDGRLFEIEINRKKLKYIPLKYTTHEERYITNHHLISKLKLKGTVCRGNRCPHRGYDLSTVPWEDGVRHCPLHGTMVNKKGIVI